MMKYDIVQWNFSLKYQDSLAIHTAETIGFKIGAVFALNMIQSIKKDTLHSPKMRTPH